MAQELKLNWQKPTSTKFQGYFKKAGQTVNWLMLLTQTNLLFSLGMSFAHTRPPVFFALFINILFHKDFDYLSSDFGDVRLMIPFSTFLPSSSTHNRLFWFILCRVALFLHQDKHTTSAIQKQIKRRVTDSSSRR